MAVVRGQGGPVLTGVHVALIAFVAVTVVSLVFVVLMYTEREELMQRADRAAAEQRSASQKEEAAREDRGRLAHMLTGNRDADAAQIEQQAKALRERLEKLGDFPQLDARLLNMANQVVGQYDARSKEAKACREKSEQTAAQYEERLKQYQEREKQYGSSTSEFQKQFEERTASTEAMLKQQVRPVEILMARLLKKDVNAVDVEQDIAKAQEELARLLENDQQLKNAREALANREREFEETQKRIEGLRSQLAKFRPSNDPREVLRQADGKVLRVMPDQAVCYINLGRRDRVTPGLTFAVYSPYTGVTREGRGKATIEVTDVFADTSQCKITSVEEKGGIVVAGDLIANPVFGRGRTFNFVVAGDFDLDFDRNGEVDDVGGARVKKLIEAWGGRVVDKVDEQTDFVVLGRAPSMNWAATQPIGAERPDDEAIRIHTEAFQKQLDGYNQIRAAAQTFTLPILTRLEFLQFVGYRVPPAAIKFAIAGDFDLNLDGVPDDRGGVRIRGLIRNWGGEVVDSVDAQTDFLVLGALPEKLADAERFNRLKEAAEKLAVPALTCGQLLELIGQASTGPGGLSVQAGAFR